MTQNKSDKSILNLNLIILSVMLLGLVALFLIKVNFAINISILIYLGWVVVCLLAYAFSSFDKNNDSSEFDFYKATTPVTPQAIKQKKFNTEERIGISISQDGLDPMVIFNEDKSGVVSIIKLGELPESNKLKKYFSDLEITSQQLGSPIESQTLLKLTFNNSSAYCRLTEVGENERVEFAFPQNDTDIYVKTFEAIHMLMGDHPELSVSEVNVVNYQTLLKFYNYVKRLSAPENRCIEYISYYKGNLKICNSSYVELYDCTLQSTLTSWINQDGLIRTDNVDLERGEQIHLVTLDLPFEECRLVNIQMSKIESSQVVILHLMLAEISEDELTGNTSGLTLVMKSDDIEIKQDEMPADDLISIQQYFELKCYQKFA